MPSTSARLSRLIGAVGLAVASAAVVLGPTNETPGARAATPVYVDGAGVCNGSLPCFTTIQAGVNNAGPEPAQVYIFPGSYVEDVDLSLMGSAIAGSAGSITLTTVNASGVVTDGTMTLTANLGDGIYNSVEPFPGDLTLQGVHVTSPDGNGIRLTLSSGDVEIDAVEAFDSVLRGAFIQTAGEVLISDSLAELNVDDGFHVEAGAVIVTNSTADGSETADGFDLEAPSIAIDDSTADGNDGSGFELDSVGVISLDDVHADLNDVGVEIGDGGVAIAVTITDSSANDNLTEGFTLDALDNTSSQATLTRVHAEDNGDDGVEWDAGASVTLACSVITGSGDRGVEVAGPAPDDSSLRYNNLSNNESGVTTEVGTLDAENNYWGATDGPSGAGPGTGDPAGTGVDFTPFLTSPVSEPCPPSSATATPTHTRTPSTPSSGGGGSPNSTGTPIPTSTTPATAAPPQATATQPGGGAGAGGIAPPDTGSGSAERGGRNLGLAGALALAFAGLSATAAGRRLGRRS